MTSSRRSRTRTRSRPPLLRLAAVAMACLGAFGVAIYAFVSLANPRPDPADARAALSKSLALLNAGNVTAARNEAVLAVRADPSWGLAHAILARTQLAQDDGLAAEAELRRAAENGFDAKRTHQLMAHALLLQGQADKAIDEAEKTDPRYSAYGLRVRARALTALGNLPLARAALTEAVRIAPNDAAVWTDVGRFRFTVGDLAEAIRASERAARLNPRNVDALVLRGETVRTQFGLVAALPWFEAALKVDPWHHDALIEYAATLGDVGRTKDMLAAVQRAQQVRPTSAQAFYLQSVLAARAGNYELARTLLDRTGGALTGVPGAALLGGVLDLEEGDFEQAIEKLRPLVATQPMNLTARRLYGLALLRTDAARDALEVLKPVVAREDADSYSLALVGRAFERVGERATAARYLDRAAYPGRADAGNFSADDSVAVLAAPAAEDPNDPATVIPLVRALLDNDDRAGALARASQLARTNPGAPGAQVLLGDVLMLAGRNGEAAAAFKRAADVRFDEATMLRLVEALDRAGNREEAANVLALFLSQNPNNASALRLAGNWQLGADEFDAAIETLEKLRARIGDGDAALNAQLALAYSGAGEKQAAVEAASDAYAVAPGNPAVADAYGWALYQTGDLQGALELLQKAVVLAPRHAMLRWHLAQVLADLDRKDDARAMLQAALADPSFTGRGEAADLLAQLN